jgi:Homeodomain-like domain
MERDRRIWAMRAAGHTIRDIADAVGCGVATVDRALKRLVTAPWEEGLDDEEEFGGQLDAALARYADGSMACADARTPEDVAQLNDLEYFRLGHLPPDHPAKVANGELMAAGWRHPSWSH